MNSDANIVGYNIGHTSFTSCNSHGVVKLWDFGSYLLVTWV
jgi:hypothetical protein